MVGGAPVTQEYADAVGVYGYAAERLGDRQARQGPHRSSAAPRSPGAIAAEPQETCPPLGLQGGLGLPRSPLLPDRLVDRPYRPPDLPGAAAGRRLLRDIERDVKAQVEGGADVLDVNMGVPLTDEPGLAGEGDPARAVADGPADLHRLLGGRGARGPGLVGYEGRALVNSITAEDDRMAAILPLVKKYDAAVIALPNDHDEIPMECGEAARPGREDRPGGHRGVRHREGRHRDRPAGHADRRRHQQLAGRPWRPCAGSATSTA